MTEKQKINGLEDLKLQVKQTAEALLQMGASEVKLENGTLEISKSKNGTIKIVEGWTHYDYGGGSDWVTRIVFEVDKNSQAKTFKVDKWVEEMAKGYKRLKKDFEKEIATYSGLLRPQAKQDSIAHDDIK